MVRAPQSSLDVPAPDFFERIREKSPAAKTRQKTKAWEDPELFRKPYRAGDQRPPALTCLTPMKT